MKRRSQILAALIIAGLSFSMAACGNKKDAAASSSGPVETISAGVDASSGRGASSSSAGAAGALQAESIEQKTIGKKSEAGTDLTMIITNKTGQSIKGLSVKNSADTDYPDGLLSEGDSFAIAEQRTLYYSPAEGAAADASYDVRLTFSDGSQAEIREFPFTYTKAVDLGMSGGKAYLTYKSSVTGKDVDTRKQEGQAGEESSATDQTGGENVQSGSAGQAAGQSGGTGTAPSTDQSGAGGAGSTGAATGNGSGSDASNLDAQGGYYGMDDSGFFYQDGQGGRHYSNGTQEWYVSPSGVVQ